MTKISFTLAFLLASATALSAQTADRILLNGTFETMNSTQPTAEALAIKGGRILFVGTDDDARAFIGDETDVIDLGGKYVTPGMIESHNHVVSSAWTTSGVDLTSAQSIDDVGRLLKEHVDANPDETGPLVGYGWVPSNIGGSPVAADLDKWDLGRPTIAIGNFVHDAALNTMAMELAGIDNDTPDVQPGVMFWDRDEDGNVTGLAVEVVYFQAYVDIGAWDPERIVPESIDKLQGFLATKGVTTAMVPGLVTPAVSISTEQGKSDMREIMPILQERVDSGDAWMRLNVMPMFKLPDADPQDLVDFTLEMRDLYDSDMLRVDKIKIHPELSIIQRGATQLQPYVPASPDDPPTWGAYGVSPDRMFEVIHRANRNGLDVITHADGARLVKRLTDIIIEAKEQYPDARNRLDHFSSMDGETLDKVVLHNIPTNATPVFYNESDAGSMGSELFKVFTEAYARAVYGNYSKIAQRYDNLSLSGDTPGSPIELAYPAYLMQQAMTLIEPSIPGSQPFPPWQPTMTIDQVLHAYTVAPAWQMGMEDVIGTLEVGKYADIAIWDKNLREIDAENMIAEAIVVGTLLNGEFTHRDGI